MVAPGVLNGDEAWALLNLCKEKGAALPAVNVSNSSTLNATLETAAEVNSPVMIQLSKGGAEFYAGKSLDNGDLSASIQGAVAAARHTHVMAKAYGVPVILHTDHCAKKLLPWIDALLDAGKEYYQSTGRPLYSSHMLDLSEEPLDENIAISKAYFTKMRALDMMIEIELGVTGGEEDGVDNTDIDQARLYTQPEEVGQAYAALGEVGVPFLVAAAFGNVHGVYKPGNVELRPKILKACQKHISEKFSTPDDQPLNFVFHGGSGSSQADIREAISYGVVKMNIDTDLQWAYWKGVRDFEAENHDYLQTQIGNPAGEDQPNKKKYDPRTWLRAAEKTFVYRLTQAFDDLNALDLHNR